MNTENGEQEMDNPTAQDMQNDIEGLKIAQATQTATLAGAQATQAAASAGIMSTMAAGFVALVCGIFLGMYMRR